jgi:hypothetical protein
LHGESPGDEIDDYGGARLAQLSRRSMRRRWRFTATSGRNVFATILFQRVRASFLQLQSASLL